MNRNHSITPTGISSRQSQRGVILIYVLVALLILGIGAVALIRSFDTSTLNSANLGFKRDLTNEGQLAIAQAKLWFQDKSALGNSTVQQSNNPSYNYYSTINDTDLHGIPKALLVQTPSGLQFTGASTLPGITIYMLIDRLCLQNTVVSNPLACSLTQNGSDPGGTNGVIKAGAPASQVFRITVRVDGPHTTHAFVQQTVAAPF